MSEPFVNVPDVEFAPKDPTLISENIIRGFEAAWYQDTGEILQLRRPDARRMFLLYCAQIVIQQRAAIEYAGRQNLLKYARGVFLEAWGGNWGERGARLPASRALTTLRFSLPAPINLVVTIPIGTLVGATGNITVAFATTRVGTIPIGQTSVDVPAECQEAGTIGNDFLAGQINRLINFDVPFAISVANTTASAGGAPEQTDEQYREMLWKLPESISTCGPKAKYEWFAMRANPAIIDALAHSAPEIAGEVHVYSLLAGGLLPSDEILDQVYAILSADQIRPLTDHVFSDRPIAVDYDIDLDWYANEEDQTILAAIEYDVALAVDDFITWTKSRIGRDILPDQLSRRILNVGAKRTTIRSPIFRASEYNEVAICRNFAINFGGFERLTYPLRLPK